MALNAYLKLTGTKQGPITGSVIQKGREGKILVIAASHEVLSPRDPASGLATGKRQHKPFVITKELDKSSPLLWKALVQNETFSEFELQFWAPQIQATASTGSEVQNYTVKLHNAVLVDLRFTMPNNKNPDLMRYAEYEELSFTYDSIEWIWTAGSIASSDVWNSH